MSGRAFITILLILSVLSLGMSAPVQATTSTNDNRLYASPDPVEDTIGWENGYWHNESIAVDQSDGLTESEIEAYVSRSMARIEILREREFNHTVPVTVISRDEYVNRTSNQTTNESYTSWNNQVWEALFIVGEETDVHDELSTVSGTSTGGFYSIPENEITIVSDTPNTPTINNATLIHELVHALQDQYHNLSRPVYRAKTQDTQLAHQGLLEGEANYIEAQYAQRCGHQWECVESPVTQQTGSSPELNLGVYLTIIHPYSDGPAYVHSLFTNGNWSAVDAAFEAPPSTTEQIIHVTNESARPIRFTPTSQDTWSPYTTHGENGSDTAGEASMFSMFWYQAREYQADTIPLASITQSGPEYDLYNYDATPTTGWGNDLIYPYRTSMSNEHGYVWITRWDSITDAMEFHSTYLQVLGAHDARRVSDQTWVINDGPFADAFRVTRFGTRVIIVNGPTVSSLDSIYPDLIDRPPASPDPPVITSTTRTVTSEPDRPTITREIQRTPIPTPHTVTVSPGQPGFNQFVALIALVISLLLIWRQLPRP